MPAPEDDRFLSTREIRAAVGNGHLPVLAERLARDRGWLALASLFEQLGHLQLVAPLPMLTETVRRCVLALRASAERRRDRPGGVDEVQAIRLLAAEALLGRITLPALTEGERLALRVGAMALADGGDLHRAANTFEHAHDWGAAAEVWGRLGELEQMEACLTREEDGTRSQRAAVDAVRDIEALAAAGERAAAWRLAERIPEGVTESAAARQIALALAARLVRGRSVTLRPLDERGTWDDRATHDGARSFSFGATPAVLGRDPTAEISLRDPGVSRRHALIAVVGDEPSLTDAGSRSGTFVSGARLSSALPLRGTTEVGLGASCRLQLQLPAPGRVLVRGLTGLDRALVALVGTGALPLADLFPGAAGTWLEFDAGGVHFCRPANMQVRIAGQLVSTRVDLLHGDRLDIGGGAVRIEVA